MADLSRSSQPEVSEYVLARLGRQVPHDDALDLVDLEREASPQVRESLRRAVVDLLDRFAEDQSSFDEDAAADLLTLAAFLLDPAHPMNGVDRSVAVHSLCRLADAESEEVARRSRAVLLTLRAPGNPDFWLDLARSSVHPPDATTVFQGLSDAGSDHAYGHLAAQLANGLPVDVARNVLVRSLRRLEPANRETAQDAFLRFLDSGLAEATRLELAEVPALAGLDWILREPPARERFVFLLHTWRSLDAAGEDPDSPRFDVIRSEIVGLLESVFPLFDPDQLPIIYDGLTANLTKTPGDRLAVEAMTKLHLEDELARRALAEIEDRSWDLAAWYLDISQWAPGPKGREDIVAALYQALAVGERTPFLLAILADRPSAPEVVNNPAIDAEDRFKWESLFTSAYSEAHEVLENFQEVTK